MYFCIVQTGSIPITLLNSSPFFGEPLRSKRIKRGVRVALNSTVISFASGMMVSIPSLSAEITHFYNIHTQLLSNALVQFATESNLDLIYTAEMVRGIKVKPVVGKMSAQEALGRLLKDSGFSYLFIDKTTVTLERSSLHNSTDQESSPLILDTIVVKGRADNPRNQEADNSSGIIQKENEQTHTYSVAYINSATKTDTPVKSIPQSIQFVNRSLIDDQQSITISEALRNISGVTTRNVLFTPVAEVTLIRGFRSEQLLDGFTQYQNAGDRESTVNIEIIDVLKGSNALLYSGGAGSPVGGIIYLTSKLPKPKAFGEAGFRMGSYDFYQPYIDWNQPLNEDVLFRITGEYTNSGSPIDVIETQRYNINPALTFTGIEGTTFTLQGKISRWKQPEYQGLPATGTIAGDFRIRPETFIGPSDIGDSYSNYNGVWGTLDHKFNRTWSFNFKARYANSEVNEKAQTLVGRDLSLIADEPFLPPSTWLLTNGELFEQLEELSFLGNAQAHFNLGPTQNIFLAGADLSVLDDGLFLDINQTPAGTVDLAAPEFTEPYSPPGPGIKNQIVTNTTYGAYLQLQSDIYQRFHQLLGVRLSGIEIDDRSFGRNSKTERLELLPRVGGNFNLTQSVSLFACYSQGMRGQPFVNFASAPEPEFSSQIETGIKLDFAQRLTGQMAVYQIDRSQVAVPASADRILFNTTGKQRSQGFETDLTWQPFDELNILASYAYTDARFKSSSLGIAEGNSIAWVPENSGRLWANYRFLQEPFKGLSMGFGVYLQSGAFVSHDNLFKTAGFHSFDAVLAYETKHFKLAATAKNLSDQDSFQPFGYYLDGFLGGGRLATTTGASVFVTGSIRY